MEIVLTKLQREEVTHLFTICDDELSLGSNAHDPDELDTWLDHRIMFNQLLSGSIEHENIPLAIEEMTWHRDKFTDVDDAGMTRSMNNLINKLKAGLPILA